VSSAIEAGGFGVLLLDRDGRVLQANHPALELLSPQDSAVSGRALGELVHPDDRGWVQAELDLLLSGAVKTLRRDVRVFTYRGPEIRAELNARATADPRSPAVRVVVVLHDASDRSQREQELMRLADTDPLTELPNRRRFAAELKRHLVWASRYGARGAVLVIDVDGLKAINDSSGHLAGDRAITFTANLLRARTRASDVVARIGGDEFAILLPVATLSEAKVVAASLLDATQGQRSESSPPVTLSIGVAAVDGRDDPWGVFDSADRAMYEVKRAGGNGYASTPSGSYDGA
jgi:diguanylate cyclase (GGDEF)-like protein/PAS domain S-box-containing protein